MSNLPYFYIGCIALAAILALVAVWARRGLWVRAGATGLLLALCAVQFAALVDLLSRPKPSALEFVHGGLREAVVLAATIDEGTAIYVWLRLPEQREPRYYALPWNQKTALDLQRAMREAGRHGTRIILRLPFDAKDEAASLPKFYDAPRKQLPAKPRPEVHEYRHPSMTI